MFPIDMLYFVRIIYTYVPPRPNNFIFILRGKFLWFWKEPVFKTYKKKKKKRNGVGRRWPHVAVNLTTEAVEGATLTF